MSTSTNAPIDMPTPDITPNPCPTSPHMDMPTPILTPTSVPMDMPTPTPSPTSGAPMGTFTPTNAPTDTSTPTPSPTSAPTNLPTPTPNTTSAPTGTFTLTLTPASLPMGMPTPTLTPTSAPTLTPTGTFTLTLTPTSAPKGPSSPTPAPTRAPVDVPKSKPTASLSGLPWGELSSSNVWGSDEQYTDESSHLFSLYLAYADKHDKERAENWIAGADGILVFTGLFAAALATFVIDSYKSLLPDSGRNTVALLTQISQQIANGSQISAQAAATVSAFQPSTAAIWVNALWFLSLVISIFCALLATLQQYWARRYLRITQTQCAIHKRARLRAFFAEGVERFQLPFAVETIPTLIHISMFLFLTGLVISLFSIHHTIARIILVATVICGFVYTVITVMPVFYHNSPYQSPLSAVTWAVPRKMARIVLSAAFHIVSFQKHTRLIRADNITTLTKRISECKKRLSVSMAKAAEDAADKQDWSIDARALSWTLDQSDEESELEKFIAGIAKFTQSVRVKNPVEMLKKAIDGSKLHPNLYLDVTNLLLHATDPGLLRGSKLLPGSVKQRRVDMCTEALFFIPQNIERILRRIADKLTDSKVMRAFESVLKSKVAWGMALRFSGQWGRYRHNNKRLESIIVGARCMATVMATQLPDTRRSVLTEHLGISDPVVLERYLRSPHSFLLKNLNHFLANTALEFIHIEDTDILTSTVHIVIQGLNPKCAARELRFEFGQYYTLIRKVSYNIGVTEASRKNAKGLLSKLDKLLNPAPGNGSASAQAAAPIATPNDATANAIQSPSPTTSAPSPSPPGDVYISIPPYPETPSGETHPLMPMPIPSNHTHPETPTSAAMPMPSTSSSDADAR